MALGGAGDDTFDASRLLDIPVEFSGGDGNDTLIDRQWGRYSDWWCGG
ncbi:MAG: hypothetical protein HC796_03730 [Synechococcaceae cyanobacterium RL_1_2]|nr:hypothetical protein [Synechococcaceae cyanobacterium RL_1_2]